MDNSTQERTIAPSYSNTHGQFNTGTDHCSLLQQHTQTIQHRNGPLLPPTATHMDNSTQERTIAPSYSNTHGQFNTGTDHCSLLQQHTWTIQHRNGPLLPPTATHMDNSTQERTIAPSYSNTPRQFNTGTDHCSLLQQHTWTIQHRNGPLLPPTATHMDNSTQERTIAPSYSNTHGQFNTGTDHCSLLQQHTRTIQHRNGPLLPPTATHPDNSTQEWIIAPSYSNTSRKFNTGMDHCSLLQQHIQTIQHRNGPLLPPTATHPDNSTQEQTIAPSYSNTSRQFNTGMDHCSLLQQHIQTIQHRNGSLLPPTATHPDNSTQEWTIAPSYSNTSRQFNTGMDHCSLLQQHTQTIQHRNGSLLPPTATHPDNSTQEWIIAPSYGNTSRQFNTGMDHCSIPQQHTQTIQHRNGSLLPPTATHPDNSTQEWIIAPSYSNTSRQFNTGMDHCSLLQQHIQTIQHRNGSLLPPTATHPDNSTQERTIAPSYSNTSRQFNTGMDHCSLLQQHIQTIQHRNGSLLPPTATHPDNSTHIHICYAKRYIVICSL